MAEEYKEINQFSKALLALGVYVLLQNVVTASVLYGKFDDLTPTPSVTGEDSSEYPGANASSSYTKRTTTKPHDSPIHLRWNDNPDEEVHLTWNKVVKFTTSEENRIILHLVKCNLPSDAYVNISTPRGFIASWPCPTKAPRFRENGEERHQGFDNVIYVLDDIRTDVILSMGSIGSRNSIDSHKAKEYATIIVNVYRAGSDGICSSGFNCDADVCPKSSCNSEGSGSGSHMLSLPDARCIPTKLKCNNQPNCGWKKSDERNGICIDNYCPHEAVCLSWNYVLTSVAIAVLFIITPTAVVFALFHRRNVALERARLERLAQLREAEFTRGSLPNDHPPTYEDVCDIKTPPPCFCKATGVDKGDEAAAVSSETDRQGDSDTVIGIDNESFQCSCKDSNDACEGSEGLPSYADVETAAARENSTSSGRSSAVHLAHVSEPNESDDFEK